MVIRHGKSPQDDGAADVAEQRNSTDRNVTHKLKPQKEKVARRTVTNARK